MYMYFGFIDNRVMNCMNPAFWLIFFSSLFLNICFFFFLISAGVASRLESQA